MTLNWINAKTPSPNEIEESKNRMKEFHEQSQTIKNPNLLSEKLKKEYDPSLIKFNYRWPTKADFPIYRYNKIIDTLERLETYDDLGIMPIQCHNNLYWSRVFMGD